MLHTDISRCFAASHQEHLIKQADDYQSHKDRRAQRFTGSEQSKREGSRARRLSWLTALRRRPTPA